MAENKIHRNEKNKLKGSLRKNGFDYWRIVFNGESSVSGEEKAFIIEFYGVNPALSPKECVLGLKKNFDNLSLEDFQFIIPESEETKSLSSQTHEKPSFFMIRAGVISEKEGLITSYFPQEKLLPKQKNVIISAKTKDCSSSILGSNLTSGAIKVTQQDLSEHPEYTGSIGSIEWNLCFTKSIVFSPDYKSKDINWAILGGKADFLGKIILNGEEFSVNPKTSFGYYDKNWGHTLPTPYFHLSSSKLISDISGKLLDSTSFVIQGEYNNKLSALVCLEGKNIEFHADKDKKYSVTYDCKEISGYEDEGEKLRWQVSINSKKYIIDIEVLCYTKDLALRDFELPEGNRKVIHILSGSSGNGRFKLYKKIKNNLELIEQADVSKCFCEYGNIESLS